MPSKLEPEFGHRSVSPEAPAADTPAPKGVRIDRSLEVAATPLPKRTATQPQPRIARGGAAAAAAMTPAESFDDEDLEIPAFLRRRAN